MNTAGERLTLDSIRRASSDDALIELLFAELTARDLPSRGKIDAYLAATKELPRGLRAMAVTYELDVSMSLDDLAWHFRNWHHRGLSEATSRGLHELETGELAQIFDTVLSIIEPHWDKFGQERLSDDNYHAWFQSCGLDDKIKPLNWRWWELCPGGERNGLFGWWVSYARKYPERTIDFISLDS